VVLRDRYRLNEVLETDRIGTLYRADDLTSHRTVVLRILDEPVPHAHAAVRRFQLRAPPDAAPLATHPTFVTVLDCDLTDDGRLFLALSPVGGSRLSDLIHGGKRLELGRTLRLAIQIGEGLDLAHNLGVVGLDVTPARVMVGSEDEVTLLGSDAVTLRQLGVGNRGARSVASAPLRYAPPELAQGGEPTEESDIYAYGLLVYELLTGTLPTDTSGPRTPGSASAPTRLRALRRDVPSAVERVVLQTLEEQPGRRPHGMSIVLNELWMHSNPVGRPPWWRVGPVAGVLGVAVLTVCVLTVWMTVLSRHGGESGKRTIAAGTPVSQVAIGPGELGTTAPDWTRTDAASAAATAVGPETPRTTPAREAPAGTMGPASGAAVPVPLKSPPGPSAAASARKPGSPPAAAPAVPPPRIAPTTESASPSSLPPRSPEATNGATLPLAPPGPPVRPQPDPTPPSPPPPAVQDAQAIIDWVLGQSPRFVP
jgi:serine/threonine protein kinase